MFTCPFIDYYIIRKISFKESKKKYLLLIQNVILLMAYNYSITTKDLFTNM